MAELIKKQDAIDAVLKAHCYGTDIMEALQKLPTTTEAEIRARAIDDFTEKLIQSLDPVPVTIGEYGIDMVACDFLKMQIKDLAEQLKGE